MVNRVIPRILNGNKELVLTETLSFLPKEGLKIIIPTLDLPSGKQSELTLKFTFIDKAGESPSIKQSVENNILSVLFINFNDTFGIGTTVPLSFTFGGSQYHLLIITKALINQTNREYVTYTMTFSIYVENNK